VFTRIIDVTTQGRHFEKIGTLKNIQTASGEVEYKTFNPSRNQTYSNLVILLRDDSDKKNNIYRQKIKQ
jgi:hypothetical protein